ncbi:MAG: alpha-amylase family glycosyl hydrolase [Pseudomonadota bacterium]
MIKSRFAAVTAVLWSAFSGAQAAEPGADAYLERAPEDEVVYFVLPDRFENGDAANDRGGLDGDKFVHGYDPAHKGFYHGGDLKGLTARLDYIQGLGATAIWLGPIYKNKPVQGSPGEESAGYHGYWITDFTAVDPHFGTQEDLKAFVDATHARGIKIYLDIITNHTADVISYRECYDPTYPAEKRVGDRCEYRNKAEFPWTTRGDARAEAINDGFMGDAAEFQTRENFAKLTQFDYAYTPYIPEGEENVKKPDWLNDIRYYHNRGETTFEGENSLYGDFHGLDDLMTAHPDVVDGFIDIFKTWITDYRIDGFRVDTARHVNPEFWQAFVPAMVEHAKSEGIPNFYVFGESYLQDVAALAVQMRQSRFPAALDFPLNATIKNVLIHGANTSELGALFEADILYPDGAATARRMPTFVGNHDMGRFAGEAQRTLNGATDADLLKRTQLAHAMLFFARGAPVIYAGSEQGFTGDGGDQDAREDMFPSVVDIYNDNTLLGTAATTAEDNFDRRHPLYRAFAEMAKTYRAHAALRSGKQVVRLAQDEPGGLLALSRFDPETGAEFVIAFNTGTEERTAHIETDPRSRRWRRLAGNCVGASDAAGSYRINVKPLDYIICQSKR